LFIALALLYKSGENRIPGEATSKLLKRELPGPGGRVKKPPFSSGDGVFIVKSGAWSSD